MWHGDIAADEIELFHLLKCFCDLAGLNLEADVADVFALGVERSLVHCWGSRVAYRVADDCQACRLVSASIECFTAG